MLYNQFNKCTALFLLLIVIGTLSYSQVDTGNQAKTVDTSKKSLAKDQPKQKDSSEKKLTNKTSQQVKVLEVFNSKYRDSGYKRHNTASIGDIIVVKVENMDSLISLAQCKDGGGCTPQKICLFVNGRIIDNIFPISGAPQKLEGLNVWKLQFQLDRNQENDKIWATILGSPPILNKRFFIEPVTISIGLQHGYAIATKNFDESNFQFERIHEGWFWSCFVIIIIYLLVFIMMVKRRGLLRDRTIDLSTVGIADNGQPRSYSLGRFQMAFWFTLTIISFFFIWLITDAYDIITPTVLALIGISAGTSLSAAVIDNSKSTDLLNQTITLQNEKTRLVADILILSEQINYTPGDTDLKAQKKIKEDRITEIVPLITRNMVMLTPQQSEGFLTDVLSDANGISFHRLQMLVWTFILGLIFLYSVWKNLSMPVFSATLLALQGLTATTYLGFKFPEKQV